MILTNEKDTGMVGEKIFSCQTGMAELVNIFQPKVEDTPVWKGTHTGLQPIIKWAGGKEKELNHILPNIPSFNRYFEPFVGGGSVFAAIHAKEYFINDLSSELISLYQNISLRNPLFFTYVKGIDKAWIKAKSFFENNQILVKYYIEYRRGKIDSEHLKARITTFCKVKKQDILAIIDDDFAQFPCILVKEIGKNLFRKMSRMKKIEQGKGILPKKDLQANIETAIKSAVYMNFRSMYNDKELVRNNDEMRCALFLFIRNYAYSGMFRYNDKGNFNVPYGGIAYNGKTMQKKLNYYQSSELLDHFGHTKIFNMDFEQFLRETNPEENDFIFLDPPYDTEFNTYAQNKFTRADQERLADYMLNICEAKWMMIVKNTDFIYHLYNHEGVYIRSFNKEYLVSFMNRNNKKVTHLLITNYEQPTNI